MTANARGVAVISRAERGIDAPEVVKQKVKEAKDFPVLKIKVGTENDAQMIAAVRDATDRPLRVDANEGWHDKEQALEKIRWLQRMGVELIEQPLPAGRDAALAHIERLIPLCADESAHDRASLEGLMGRYDAVNIKLDKTGGLTEALEMAREARERGLAIMAGCMVGTSLAMAPATLVAQFAAFVDLDGPLLLARDREPGLVYEGSTLYSPQPELWG